ncbi:hypothetical protein PYW08_011733 [Mythimna loreyi]|uniref:Uncharacterized protein n=1 Tax=Mythimna loreyi TaxID=667449 RepID=A0ACC2QL97_9NEOP|nr:hypothetical protein PYW08_011733 [Mythimna loreyi]
MSKFICFVLCVVAFELSCYHVLADTPTFRDSLKPLIEACAKEYPGVTIDIVDKATEAANPYLVNPCFNGCVFKKAGFINDKGEYDTNSALTNLRKLVTHDEQYRKLAEIARQCTSAIGLSSSYVQAKTPTFRDSLQPILEACSKLYPAVSSDIVNKATEHGNPNLIHPCFNGCVFKKAGFINEKGEYDTNSALTNLRKLVTHDEQYRKLAEIARQCTSVKDTVSDGEAGCERGARISACFLKQKDNVSL